MSMRPDLSSELRRHNLWIPLLQRQIAAKAVANEEISNENIAEAKKHFLANHNLTTPEELEVFLRKQGWDNKDFEWQISLPLKIKLHCQREYRHKAEAHFLKRKNQLDQIVYSLLRVKDQYLAQELYWRIEMGEANFGELATTYAEGPESNTMGIIGPVPLSQAHPVLAEKLRISKPGALMRPFQIGEWWIIARLEKYKSATFDEAMAEGLSRELFDQWINQEVAITMEKEWGV